MGNTANNLSKAPLKGSASSATEDDRKWFAKHKRRHIRVRTRAKCEPCGIGERRDRMAVVVFEIRPGMRSRLVTELPGWCSIGDFKAEDMAACLLFHALAWQIQAGQVEHPVPLVITAVDERFHRC
jgi:hypothetical protein